MLMIVGLTVGVLAAGPLVAEWVVAAFAWEKTTIDVGEIVQDVPKEVLFEFTNDGDAPLIISRTQGSCGCTVSDYTKEAIAPGESGWVKATYNAKAMGAFHKTVTVYSNVPGDPVRLALKGTVISE